MSQNGRKKRRNIDLAIYGVSIILYWQLGCYSGPDDLSGVYIDPMTPGPKQPRHMGIGDVEQSSVQKKRTRGETITYRSKKRIYF